MPDFALLDLDIVLAIHEEQLAIHGGGRGLHDLGLLESALARPQTKVAYGSDVDCPALAAAYAFGIARNHPFVDGNKRTAFVAMELCLRLNDFVLVATDEDALMAMLNLAAGETTEDQFADWIRDNLEPVRE